MALRTRRVAAAAAMALSVTAVAGFGAPRIDAGSPATAPAGILTSALSTPALNTAQRASQPNILMVTVDDAAPSDLRWMPIVRRQITQHGVKLNNAVAPTPICVPARASLLTGQYTHNHGALTIRGESGGFDSFEDSNTLPVWLQNAGYDTFFVGKYLNGYGEKASSRTYIPPGWTGWTGSIDRHTYDFAHTVTNRDGRLVRKTGYNSDAFARRASAILKSPARATKPWYMWVNYVAPHFGGPRQPDDPTVIYTKPRLRLRTTVPAARHRNMFKHRHLPRTPAMFEDTSDKYVPGTHTRWSKTARLALREAYQQRIESLQAVDEAIGKHLSILRRNGQLANTIVVFASDNGYNVGEHNLFGKLWFHDNSLKVPMVMRGPGIPEGRVIDTLVTNVDLPVTFAAAAGASPGRVTDGVDVLPLLAAGREIDRVVPIEAYPVKIAGSRRLYSGIRVSDEWTYALYKDRREELYDLERDPFELDNVAGMAAYADTLTRMRKLNNRYADCAGSSCPGVH